MKVEQTNQNRAVSSARKSSTPTSSQGTNFASVLAGAIGGTDNASEVSSPSGVSAVDSVFMVQAIGDATEGESRKRRAVD